MMKMKLTARAAIMLLAVAAVMIGLTGAASAATGDLVGSVTFSQDCGGQGLGTGIAFDGQYLWVSCFEANPDLLRADPVTGAVSATYNIDNGLGSVAYDANRNALWAGWGNGASGQVYLINLDAAHNVTTSAIQFSVPAGEVVCGLDDGIAYDGTDDTLYISDDCSTTVYHHTTAGALLGSFPWSGAGCYNSGLAIGGSLLFEGSDGCSHVWVVDKVTQLPAFDFSTVVAGDPNFRDEGLSCDTLTFASLGKQVMWSKEAYSPNRAHAFEIPLDTCGVGGQPAVPRWMTGGGSVFTETGVRVTHGFELYCQPSDQPNHLQVNWGKGNKFHLTSLTSGVCTDDPAISPNPPTATFDTYTGSGTGTYNGQAGATADWTFTDAGEPGTSDTARLTITDANNVVVLSVGGTLDHGNHQAHDG
jgi:hypothetical protein